MNSTLATVLCFTLPVLMTTLGSALVFFFKKTSKTLTTLTLGLAGGIMFSASIWSLLLPALDDAELQFGRLKVIPIALGFLIGVGFMIFLDFLTAKLFKKDAKRGKTFRFFTAITVHNIPEGLSVGFAIGSAVASSASPLLAFMFALGIAIQNFPEGLATALPIYTTLKSRKKAFFLGTLSGVVEPIASLIGFFLATSLAVLQPWLLAFSAGAMIFVIIEELTPELSAQHLLGTISFVIGFLVMMILDLSF